MRKLLTYRQEYVREYLLLPAKYIEAISKVEFKVYFVFSPPTTVRPIWDLGIDYNSLIYNCLSK
jgi:hypothetical protein